MGLQTNCASVAEEVDEIYRRLSKALKDRTEHLRNEVDRYLGAELRGLIQLKENLELEIANIQSNCDLAEAHINENVPWDDAELLDTKELFLRTVEFIRFVAPLALISLASSPFSLLPFSHTSPRSHSLNPRFHRAGFLSFSLYSWKVCSRRDLLSAIYPAFPGRPLFMVGSEKNR